VNTENSIQRLNRKYADRLDCPIDAEGVGQGDGYFVDLKDGWTFDFQGQSGSFDSLAEVRQALANARKEQG